METISVAGDKDHDVSVPMPKNYDNRDYWHKQLLTVAGYLSEIDANGETRLAKSFVATFEKLTERVPCFRGDGSAEINLRDRVIARKIKFVDFDNTGSA